MFNLSRFFKSFNTPEPDPKLEYVYMITQTGDRLKRVATKAPLGWYATPHESDSVCLLLPDGAISGTCLVHSWEPLTAEVFEYYQSHESYIYQSQKKPLSTNR